MAALCCAMLTLPTGAFAQSADKSRTFNWFSNAAVSQPTADKAKARAVLRKARLVNARATWVCSPAGFGHGSSCSRR